MTRSLLDTKPMRILQLAHNHPDSHPGGTEIVALALHREALARGEDSWFLGALDGTQRTSNPGTQMIAITPDQREAAIFFDDFIRFKLEQDDRYRGLRELRCYLELMRPDVVHVHHVLNFGLELFFLIRSTLPSTRIIFTLHDYYLICANNGQLYKHDTAERCDGPSLIDCLRCFPKLTGPDFVMRELDVMRAVGLVDHLVAPSIFLKQKIERHVRNCPPVTVIENGYVGDGDGLDPTKRVRENEQIVLGYFGNISAVKGLADLLEAACILTGRGRTDFVIHVHGAQLFEDKQLRAVIENARRRMGGRLVLFGKYDGLSITTKMSAVDAVVFPSLWWENAPLVVYEALHHRKLVLSYPHGGAPEILARYSTGLTAERSDAVALAVLIERVLDTPALAKAIEKLALPRIADLFDACKNVYSAN